MNKEIHGYLVSVDEKGNWEFPKDGRWDIPFDEVISIKPDLEKITGVTLDVDKNVQDASFLTDLGLLDERYYDREKKSGTLSYLFSIRFSNFGRMFTIMGSEWPENENKYSLGEVIEFLQHRDYKYIPEAELHEPYDGVNEPFEPKLSWWIRYFDYL
jgi:hypothetical protein